MKKLIALLLSVTLLLTFSACAGNTPANHAESEKESTADHSEESNNESAASAQTSEDPSGAESGSDTQISETPVGQKSVLVVVFSATGTTKGVAEKIAAIENADLYEIKAAQEYTNADLNWNDRNSRSTKEQNDGSVRPEIGSENISLDGYEKIYIGFPIWWGEEPRIMDTFVESHDFGDITVIPFCTSSSSGIGRSGKNLADNAKSGVWLDGKRFPGSVSESELRDWIDGLK